MRRSFQRFVRYGGPDTMPLYRTAPDGTETAPVTELVPGDRKNYVSNRTGIQGYDTLDENWK